MTSFALITFKLQPKWSLIFIADPLYYSFTGDADNYTEREFNFEDFARR